MYDNSLADIYVKAKAFSLNRNKANLNGMGSVDPYGVPTYIPESGYSDYDHTANNITNNSYFEDEFVTSVFDLERIMSPGFYYVEVPQYAINETLTDNLIGGRVDMIDGVPITNKDYYKEKYISVNVNLYYLIHYYRHNINFRLSDIDSYVRLYNELGRLLEKLNNYNKSRNTIGINQELLHSIENLYYLLERKSPIINNRKEREYIERYNNSNSIMSMYKMDALDYQEVKLPPREQTKHIHIDHYTISTHKAPDRPEEKVEEVKYNDYYKIKI